MSESLVPIDIMERIDDASDPDEEFLSGLSDRERRFVLARLDDASLTPKQLSARIGVSESRVVEMWKKKNIATYISRKLREISRMILDGEAAISMRLISKIDEELMIRMNEDSDPDSRIDAIALLSEAHTITLPDGTPKKFSAEEARIVLKSRMTGMSPAELVSMRDKLIVTGDKIASANSESDGVGTEIIDKLSKNYLRYGRKAAALDIAIYSPSGENGFEGATTFISMRKTSDDTDDDNDGGVIIDVDAEEDD